MSQSMMHAHLKNNMIAFYNDATKATRKTWQSSDTYLILQ